MPPDLRDYVVAQATEDVADTLRWLEESAFLLTSAQGGRTEPFGNLRLVYEGPAGVVTMIRERSVWSLDVASDPAGKSIQYDLAVAAAQGRDWRVYPHTPGAHLDQIPEGVSWRRTLPGVLRWLSESGDQDSIALAADQRYVFMWPDSHKARDIRRRWKAEGRA
jgi:hypothetical protein